MLTLGGDPPRKVVVGPIDTTWPVDSHRWSNLSVDKTAFAYGADGQDVPTPTTTPATA